MRKRFVYPVEIFIWSLICIVIGYFAVNSFMNHLSKRQTYEVKFKDIDGIIVGSPVRLMGIQVGHISEIKPLNDRVHIKFVITRQNITVPEKAQVAVQFTGMAGSKSLELYPSKNNDNNTKQIQSVEPIRINSIMKFQNDIAESTLTSAKGTLAMLGHGTRQELEQKIKKAGSITKKSDEYLAKTNELISKTNSSFGKTSSSVKKMLAQQNENIDSLNEIFRFSSNETIDSINKKISKTGESLERLVKNDYPQTMANKFKKLSHKTKKMNKQLPAKKEYNFKFVNLLSEKLNSFSDFITKSITPQNIDSAKEQSDKINNATHIIQENL